MFDTTIVNSPTDQKLSEFVDSSPTIHSQSQIIAEWNLNMFDNIRTVGNYKNRPAEVGFSIASTFVEENASTVDKKYFGFTDSDIVTDGGYDDTGIPISFLSKNQKNNMLYSLEDCFQKFRPRSGINKLVMFPGKYIAGMEAERETFIRPRYYIADKEDKFKYWTSYRRESYNKGTDAIAEIDSVVIGFTTRTITNAVATTTSGVTSVTYTISNTLAANPLSEGLQVEITGISPSSFNLSDVEIVSTTPTTFTVTAPTTFSATYSSGGSVKSVSGVIEYIYEGDNYDNTFSAADVISIRDGTTSELDTNIEHKIVEDITDKIVVVSATQNSFTINSKEYANKIWQNTIDSAGYPNRSGRVASRYDFSKERGISRISSNPAQRYIDDAAPFVIYNNPVPANRIVVKMQTNVSKETNESRTYGNVPDPFYGDDNKTVPKNWRIEYLNGNNVWSLAIDLSSSPLVPDDGYLEISYGLLYTSKTLVEGEPLYDYSDTQLIFAEEYSSAASLPVRSINNYAYLVKSGTSVGTYYVWSDEIEDYETFVPEYGWYVGSDTPSSKTAYVKDLTNPSSYSQSGSTHYRDLKYINGIRLVVNTMNTQDSTFDLIEMSPRLVADLTEKVTEFSLNKSSADLGSVGLPIGQLLASTGSISLFDYDMAFNNNNTKSILNTFVDGNFKYTIPSNNLQFKIYDVLYDNNGVSYHVPIKTMYVDGLPETKHSNRVVSLTLRDLFFLFESSNAPQVLVPNASVSFAVASLLDSVGFSNYIFYRAKDEVETVIPYFYVGPDQNISQVLQDLAISTQTAMFFDEYNNLVIMSRNYMLSSDRAKDSDSIITIKGSKDQVADGIISNKYDGQLSNIIEIASEESQIFNDGKIQYNTRYIQRSYGTLQEASLLSTDRVWYYQPVLLWEVAPPESVRPINDDGGVQSAYSLAAIPLKADITDAVPTVDENGNIINNTIDLGEAVFWLPRYNGFFYSSGEVIKYDAVRYNVPTMPVKNLEANLSAGSKTVSLSYGSTSKMAVGQTVSEDDLDSNLVYNISKKSLSGNVATLTTTSPHNLLVGYMVSVEIGDSVFNGTKRITAVTPTTFSYAKTNADIPIADATGTVASTTDPYSIIERSLTSNVVTLKLSTPHHIKVGDEVLVDSVETVFMGRHTVTQITADSILYKKVNADVAKITAGDGLVTLPARAKTKNVQFAPGAKVSRIINSSSFEVDKEHLQSGAVQFEAKESENLFWIRDAEEYSNYFSKMPFGGKMYPNGEVRIFAEPYYIAGGSIKTGAVARHGRGQFSTEITTHSAGIRDEWIKDSTKDQDGKEIAGKRSCRMKPEILFAGDPIPDTVQQVKSGMSSKRGYSSGVIRSIGSSKIITEDTLKNQVVPSTGTVQASALIMSGPVFGSTEKPLRHIMYSYKKLGASYQHYGTRMRIVGELTNSDGTQNPTGAMTFTDVKDDTGVNNTRSVAGASGGLGIWINPETNQGYYLELVALTDTSLLAYDSLYDSNNKDVTIYNAFFYKIQREKGKKEDDQAIPVPLWKGKTQVTVDDGGFTGQYKISGEPNSSINDIAIEYKVNDKNSKHIDFSIYINDKFIVTVTDTFALPKTDNIALFTRGSSKCMFENVYAIKSRFGENGEYKGFENPPVSNEVFGFDNESVNGTLRKFAVSGLIKDTVLRGINSVSTPNYDIYYEEFGSILRECAAFNIKYDKAYPALYSKMSPTFNNLQGYSVSGFTANAYGAEFMIFNTSDSTINLDSTSGNYLRIQGVTFTQQSAHELTVDEYMKKKSDFNNVSFGSTGLSAVTEAKNTLSQIKDSRITYGKKEFTLAAPYIQSQDAANNMMEWIISKIMKPRKSMGIKIFANSLIQVGDMIKVDYVEKSDPLDSDYQDVVADSDKVFVVYHIEYSKDSQGPNMTIYVSEVI
jgi:hypothetical protein